MTRGREFPVPVVLPGTNPNRLTRGKAVTVEISVELFEQGFGIFEIGGVEAFSEPAIGLCQHRVSFFFSALAMPQACKARSRSELKPFRLLVIRDADRFEKAPLYLLGGR